jgi:N-acetyl-gamma-glutamylphosphate reductase
MRVRDDDGGFDGEGLASHYPFLHAASHHGLERFAQEIALAEAAVSVFVKRQMTRDVAVEPQATEPTVIEPESLNGTNDIEIHVFANEARRQALLVAKFDNLGKGASGAAVQNLMLMLGR